MTTPEDRKKSDLKSPPLPRVTRIKRNVLLVAGLGVGITVVLVSRFVGSGPQDDASEGRQSRPRVEAGAAGMGLPGFLRRPQDAPVPPPAYPDSAETSEDTDSSDDASLTSGTPAVQAATQRPQQETPPSPGPREDAYQRALRAGLRPEEDQPSGAPIGPSPVEAASAFDPHSVSAGAGARLASGPLAGVIPGSPAFTAGAQREMAAPDHHEAFLEATAEEVEPEPYIAGNLVEPVSEYQLMAGTVLPAMMVTAMNSDMPGEILAQISRDVYDSQQRHVLIPRGTRVLGRYDNQVSLGQSRALVAWTRLIFPDGRSLSLPGLPTKDLLGASGVESEVDNHYMRVYGQGVLLSIIGAAAQLSQPQQSSTFSPPSPGQIAAGEIGRQLSQISLETIRRNMDIHPTLKIEAGTPFYIFLARDLVLEDPYVDQRRAARQP